MILSKRDDDSLPPEEIALSDNADNDAEIAKSLEAGIDAELIKIDLVGEPDPIALAATNDLALCKRYAGIAPEELAVLHATIIARPRKSKSGAA